MPNKDVDNLKGSGDRAAAKEWKEALNLDRMTTREWNQAADMKASGADDDSISSKINEQRRK